MSKAEKDKTETAIGPGRRTREDIFKKWDQTDSPEISDRGETSEIPRPPFGAQKDKGRKEAIHFHPINHRSDCHRFLVT